MNRHPKKFGLISLRITHENHSNNTVTATFLSVSLAHFGSSEARLIQAIITKIKHTIKTRAIAIFVNAHIIVGNAIVASVFHSHVFIQFHIIGKQVFSLIQLHSP